MKAGWMVVLMVALKAVLLDFLMVASTVDGKVVPWAVLKDKMKVLSKAASRASMSAETTATSTAAKMGYA